MKSKLLYEDRENIFFWYWIVAMNAGNCYCGGVYGTNRKVSDSLCNSVCHEASPGGLNCGGPGNYYYIYQLGTDYCPVDSKINIS